MYKAIVKDYGDSDIKVCQIDNEVWLAMKNLYSELDIYPTTKPVNLNTTTQIILKGKTSTDSPLFIVNENGLSELLEKADTVKAKDFEYYFKYIIMPELSTDKTM